MFFEFFVLSLVVAIPLLLLVVVVVVVAAVVVAFVVVVVVAVVLQQHISEILLSKSINWMSQYFPDMHFTNEQ